MLKEYPGARDTPEGRHHSEVSFIPLLDGYLLEVTFSASTTATPAHGLHRPYRGAILVASTTPTIQVVATSPKTASYAGTDTSRYIPLTASSSTSGTFTLWVF